MMAVRALIFQTLLFWGAAAAVAQVTPMQTPPVAAANECDFDLVCKQGKNNFSLIFKSKSGSCDADDMNVFVDFGGEIQRLELPPDWYFYSYHISKTQDSICKSDKKSEAITFYAVDKDHAFLFLKSSGRPGYDQVTVVLLKTDEGLVLDKKLLGRSKNQSLAVLKTKKGFKLRIIRDSLSFHKQVSCDCDAPFVDDWIEVLQKKGKIFADWMDR